MKGSDGRIFCGLGNNIDYEIVWDSQTINELVSRYRITLQEARIQPVEICTMRDLVQSLLAFFVQGTGGERYTTGVDILLEFSKHFSYKTTLGGTGVRAALALEKMGIDTNIHLVSINNQTRSLLPARAEILCSSDRDSISPHLIVQFNRGDTLCIESEIIEAPSSDRIIYVHDQENMELQLTDNLKDVCIDAPAVLLSGFNAIQRQDILRTRLTQVINVIKELPKEVCVFYEDAAFHQHQFSWDVMKTLSSYVSVYSLNFDELQSYVKRSVDISSPQDVMEAISNIQSISSTIVLHTKFWALAFGKDAALYKRSLKAGVTLASARFSFGDSFGIDEYKQLFYGEVEPQGRAFVSSLQNMYPEVCAVAVPRVQKKIVTTIGLGDAFVGGFLSIYGRNHDF